MHVAPTAPDAPTPLLEFPAQRVAADNYPGDESSREPTCDTTVASDPMLDQPATEPVPVTEPDATPDPSACPPNPPGPTHVDTAASPSPTDRPRALDVLLAGGGPPSGETPMHDRSSAVDVFMCASAYSPPPSAAPSPAALVDMDGNTHSLAAFVDVLSVRSQPLLAAQPQRCRRELPADFTPR
nr:vegetative cell wall protein gp1-like [Aegilops tauschii subsp. strangulata]